MVHFASCSGLLPEQVWDEPDQPRQHLFFGKPTGSATPLLWAHAEYVKLLRSTLDGKVFDSIPAVEDRYARPRNRLQLEVWKPNRKVAEVQTGTTLRVQATAPFVLHWTIDEWQAINDTQSTSVPLGIEFVDIPIQAAQRAPIRFTFYWSSDQRWEGVDYVVHVRPQTAKSTALGSSVAIQDGRPATPSALTTSLAGV
jgi:glucoamylase